MLGKEKIFEHVLFEHEHFSTHRHVHKDALMTRTQSFYYQDKATYDQRKQLNFNL